MLFRIGTATNAKFIMGESGKVAFPNGTKVSFTAQEVLSIIRAEREACAKIADEMDEVGTMIDAIRARGTLDDITVG